jgi:hypothetical protein
VEQGDMISLSTGILLSTCLLFIIFFVVVRRSNKELKDYGNDNFCYLYYGNSVAIGISSNIGTIFSICLIYGLMGATFNADEAFSIGIGIIAPIFTGFGILYYAFNYKNSKLQEYFQQNEEKKFTIIDYIGDYYNTNPKKNYFTVLVSLYYLFFIFLTLSLELAMCKVVFSEIFGLNSFHVAFLIVIIMLLTLSYVFLGGFRGVLLTDLWQLVIIMIICIGFFAIAIYFVLTTSINGTMESLSNVVDTANSKILITPIAIFYGFCVITAWVVSNYDIWTRTLTTPNIVEEKKDRKIRYLYKFDTPKDINQNGKNIIKWTGILSIVIILAFIFLSVKAKEYNIVNLSLLKPQDNYTISTKGFQFPLELTRLVYHPEKIQYEKITNKNIKSFLKNKYYENNNYFLFCQIFLVLFFIMIAITTIDTQLMSALQVFFILTTNLSPKKNKLAYKQFIIIFLSIGMIYSNCVNKETYGDWGTYWILQFLIIVPLLINSLFSYVSSKSKYFFISLLIPCVISICIFFMMLFIDTKIVANFDIIYPLLFIMPSTTVLTLIWIKEKWLTK